MKYLLIIALVAALTACGGGKSKAEPTSAPTKAPTETPTPEPVKIDIDTCYKKMQEEGSTVLYDFVQDFYVGLRDDGKTIDISVIVADDTDPNKALEYTHMLIKELNMYAAEQDPSLEAAGSDGYGGLYSRYQALVGVSTPSAKDDSDKWLIYDAVTNPQQFVELQ